MSRRRQLEAAATLIEWTEGERKRMALRVEQLESALREIAQEEYGGVPTKAALIARAALPETANGEPKRRPRRF